MNRNPLVLALSALGSLLPHGDYLKPIETQKAPKEITRAVIDAAEAKRERKRAKAIKNAA